MGSPPGAWGDHAEEREQRAARLADFVRELGDEAPLSATITRAANLFVAANLPVDQWGDCLYQARAITQERTAQIRTLARTSEQSFRRKNKMPYFFAVLAALVDPSAHEPPLATPRPSRDRAEAGRPPVATTSGEGSPRWTARRGNERIAN
jgi:hypothetical protein